MDDGLAEALLELEHRGWQSLCAGKGDAFYGELLTEDGLMVLSTGAWLRREDVLVSLGEVAPWDGYAIEEVLVVPVGADAAALVYRGTGHRDDDDDVVGMMTSVYVRDGDGWALALYTQTPLP